ncbi:unnamed protein product [Linum trigynum]|uniref:Uncharacterized protein n=1 Tax=Linum trigynum TaxID=586398 RepID=A0AAV2GVZ0_9ROSI
MGRYKSHIPQEQNSWSAAHPHPWPSVLTGTPGTQEERKSQAADDARTVETQAEKRKYRRRRETETDGGRGQDADRREVAGPGRLFIFYFNF